MCTGIKVAEYMAAKKPVVTAAPWWNMYSELLENGVNALWCRWSRKSWLLPSQIY
jgi:hypothetical protein